MKKLDKLILGSFIGPFILTFLVVIFILLSQFMLKYIDEIVGKDLGAMVIVELMFYFSIFMTPNAFPLAVLLSSLMTFGNLGQHFELTAMKGSGISLVRVLFPIFVFTLFLSGAAYYSNNFIVPKANLKAFSLLYDVKQMKPSMELKEGSFYNGIEGYSIKVGEKLDDGKTLKNIIIYDHTEGKGNKNVTLADSGQMYNIMDDNYLVLEMFNGNTYVEQKSNRRNYLAQQQPEPFLRNEFETQKVVFSLASFDLKRTKEELFASNRLMKNSTQLANDVDSMKFDFKDKTEEVKEHSFKFFDYHVQDIVGIYKQRAIERDERRRAAEMSEEERRDEELVMRAQENVSSTSEQKITLEKGLDSVATQSRISSDTENKGIIIKQESDSAMERRKSDSIRRANIKRIRPIQNRKKIVGDKDLIVKEEEVDTTETARTYEENIEIVDSLMNTPATLKMAFNRSLTHVRYVKNNMAQRNGQLDKLKAEINKFQLERYKKLSYAVTILIMFFIGAPLGSIIKKGGLGVPVIISISFFILFYIISMVCEKYTRTDIMDPLLAAWMSNILLFPVGMFFLRQARNDARLFDTDFYSIFFLKVKNQLFQFTSKFSKSKSLN